MELSAQQPTQTTRDDLVRQRIRRLEEVLIPQAREMQRVWLPETLARFQAELAELHASLDKRE